ncbi:hypothetical protein NX009_29690 [Klebsiella pneumoniae]|nr:hypothetical protein [Klebsiella pneumoniae]
MKTVISVLTAHFFVLSAFIWLASPPALTVEVTIKLGSDFAKQVQGNGLNSLKNFSGEQNLPGYTDNPDQTKYYGGVTASGDSSLKSDSALEFSQGDTKQNDYGVVHEPTTGSDISGCAVYSGRKGYRIPCRQHCR